MIIIIVAHGGTRRKQNNAKGEYFLGEDEAGEKKGFVFVIDELFSKPPENSCYSHR